MNRRALADHKSASKTLSSIPKFAPLKRNTLPGQYRRLGGRPRVQATPLVDVSVDHSVFFLWKDGETFTDRHFYGYLVQKLPSSRYLTLLEFHWHPSHKGFHCVTPCETDIDYTGRMLNHCRELALSTVHTLDPALESDRVRLINEFCRACGITIVGPQQNGTGELWD